MNRSDRTVSIAVTVPATTANLGPGFDCLGAALAWRNTFECSAVPVGSTPRLIVAVRGTESDGIPTDERNLVYRAIQKVFARCRVAVPPMRLRITSVIPLARGLGSSATGVVAGVLLGNRLCGCRLADRDLLDIAAGLEGHPDNVAPALLGGLCVAAMRNGHATAVRFDPPAGLRALVLVPSIRVPTSRARAVLPARYPFADAVAAVGDTALLLAALTTGNHGLIAHAVRDRLHQPYRARLMPWMDRVFALCRAHGALGAMLSGSGSAMLALFRTRDINDRAAARICSSAQKMVQSSVPGTTVSYRVLSFASKGAIVS